MKSLRKIAAAVAVGLTAATGAFAQDQCSQYMNGKVEFPFHNAFISGRDFTIEAWVRNTTEPLGELDVFSRIDPGGTENKFLRVHGDGSVSAMYQNLLPAPLTTPAGLLPFDQDWHHLAFVVDDTHSLASIYVDGVQSVVYGLAPGNVGNAIGLPALIANDGVSGWQITELRVSCAPRYDQVVHVMDESWVSDADTVLLLHFDEPAGSLTVSDQSANAMLGSVQGTVLFGLSGMHGDADGEGLLDDDELAFGTLPFDRDSDDDGLSDFIEFDAVYAFGPTDMLVPDSDGDGIQDGTETGEAVGELAEPAFGIAGSDPLLFVPDGDAGLTVTDPTDLDSDDDGFLDGEEDLDFNGVAAATELDAAKADTDGDGVQDGTESSLTTAGPFTDPLVFVPDADPLTTTDPLNPDTDGGSPWDGPLSDGKEDLNFNGAYEPALGEFDPLHPADDHFRLDIPLLISGEPFTIDVMDARPFATVYTLYTRHGWGPTYIPDIDLSVRLDPMFGRYDFPIQANANGDAVHFDTLPPIGSGFAIFYQAVEIYPGPTGLSYRLSHSRSVVVL